MFQSLHRLTAIAAVSVLVSLLIGCASQTPVPVSENGRPLSLQIVSVKVTKEPQVYADVRADMSGFDVLAASSQSGYTYNAPMKVTYKGMTIVPTESYVIVAFNVRNISRPLELSKNDILLLDGGGASQVMRGSYYKGKGTNNAWQPVDATVIDRNANTCIWLFAVRDDAIAGSYIQFQGAKYPLQ